MTMTVSQLIETLSSQCSPVWKTGTMQRLARKETACDTQSQCSPVWKTGTMLDEKVPGAGHLEVSM